MNKQKLMELLNNPESIPNRAPTAELAKGTCDYGNEMFGVSEEAREALTILSMKIN